jgi:hypothetical protein
LSDKLIDLPSDIFDEIPDDKIIVLVAGGSL